MKYSKKFSLIMAASVIGTSIVSATPTFAITNESNVSTEYLNQEKQNQYINIPDSLLKANINYSLGFYGYDMLNHYVTQEEALQLKHLVINNFIFGEPTDSLEDLTGINYFKNLERLMFKGNVKNCNEISSLNKLKFLHMTDNEFISNLDFLKNNTNLETIILTNNCNLRDISALKNCSNLKAVNLGTLPFTVENQSTIDYLKRNNPNLRIYYKFNLEYSRPPFGIMIGHRI